MNAQILERRKLAEICKKKQNEYTHLNINDVTSEDMLPDIVIENDSIIDYDTIDKMGEMHNSSFHESINWLESSIPSNNCSYETTIKPVEYSENGFTPGDMGDGFFDFNDLDTDDFNNYDLNSNEFIR